MGNVSSADFCEFVGCAREARGTSASIISENRRGIATPTMKPTVVWSRGKVQADANFGHTNPIRTPEEKDNPVAQGNVKMTL